MTDQWTERLRAAVAETLRVRAERAAVRRDLAAARQVGLAQRHAEKLTRNTPRGSRGRQRGRGPEGDPMPDELPPCCADLEEPPCEQHRQQARVIPHQGPRSKSWTGGRAIGEPGTAKPAQPEEKP